jgi:hypothetical protein
MGGLVPFVLDWPLGGFLLLAIMTQLLEKK